MGFDRNKKEPMFKEDNCNLDSTVNLNYMGIVCP